MTSSTEDMPIDTAASVFEGNSTEKLVSTKCSDDIEKEVSDLIERKVKLTDPPVGWDPEIYWSNIRMDNHSQATGYPVFLKLVTEGDRRSLWVANFDHGKSEEQTRQFLLTIPGVIAVKVINKGTTKNNRTPFTTALVECRDPDAADRCFLHLVVTRNPATNIRLSFDKPTSVTIPKHWLDLHTIVLKSDIWIGKGQRQRMAILQDIIVNQLQAEDFTLLDIKQVVGVRTSLDQQPVILWSHASALELLEKGEVLFKNSDLAFQVEPLSSLKVPQKTAPSRTCDIVLEKVSYAINTKQLDEALQKLKQEITTATGEEIPALCPSVLGCRRGTVTYLVPLQNTAQLLAALNLDGKIPLGFTLLGIQTPGRSVLGLTSGTDRHINKNFSEHIKAALEAGKTYKDYVDSIKDKSGEETAPPENQSTEKQTAATNKQSETAANQPAAPSNPAANQQPAIPGLDIETFANMVADALRKKTVSSVSETKQQRKPLTKHKLATTSTLAQLRDCLKVSLVPRNRCPRQCDVVDSDSDSDSGYGCRMETPRRSQGHDRPVSGDGTMQNVPVGQKNITNLAPLQHWTAHAFDIFGTLPCSDSDNNNAPLQHWTAHAFDIFGTLPRSDSENTNGLCDPRKSDVTSSLLPLQLSANSSSIIVTPLQKEKVNVINSTVHEEYCKWFTARQLILSGDVEPNPGPAKIGPPADRKPPTRGMIMMRKINLLTLPRVDAWRRWNRIVTDNNAKRSTYTISQLCNMRELKQRFSKRTKCKQPRKALTENVLDIVTQYTAQLKCNTRKGATNVKLILKPKTNRQPPRPLVMHGGGPTRRRQRIRHGQYHTNIGETRLWERAGTNWLTNYQIQTVLQKIAQTTADPPDSLKFAMRYSIALADEGVTQAWSETIQDNVHKTWEIDMLEGALLQRETPYIITGNGWHWRTMLIDGYNKIVYLIDPLVVEWPDNMQAAMTGAMQRSGTQWTTREIQHRIQQDGHNCGIWALFLVQIWVQYIHEGRHTAGQGFEMFLHESLEHFDREFRTNHNTRGRRLRQMYHDMLTEQEEGHGGTTDINEPADLVMTEQPRTKARNQTTREEATKANGNVTHPIKGTASNNGTRQVQRKKLRKLRDVLPHNVTSPKEEDTAEATNRKTAQPTSDNRITKKHKTAQQQTLTTWLLPNTNPQPSQNAPTMNVHKPNHPRPPNPSLECDPMDEFNLLTLNVRSMGTFKGDLEELLQMSNRPDMIVLTETKTAPKYTRSAYYKNVTGGYKTYVTSKKNEEGRLINGVMVLINTNLHTTFSMQRTDVPPHLQGTMVHLTSATTTPDKDLHIIGVYSPPGCLATQAQIYEYLIMLKTKYPEDTIITAGDWNAAATQTDRQENHWYTHDEKHKQFVDTHMTPVQLNPRPHTWYAPGMTHSSRIDDILTTGLDMTGRCNMECIDTLHLSTDHKALKMSMSYSELNLYKPAETSTQGPAQRTKFAHPIPKAALQRFQTDLLHTTGSQRLQIRQMQDRLTQKTDDKTIRQTDIDRMAEELQKLIDTAKESALTHVPTKTSNPGGQHRHKRTDNKRRKKLTKLQKAMNQITHQRDYTQWQKLRQTDNFLKHNVFEPLQTPANALPTTEHMDQCKARILQLKYNMDKELSQTANKIAKKSLRKQWDKNRKSMNKLILGKLPRLPHKPLTVMRHPVKQQLTNDGTEIKDIVHTYFSAQSKPPKDIPKTGKYTPQEVPRDYPWHNTNVDEFKIETQSPVGLKDNGMMATLSNPITFAECIRTLSNNKAPGPDGIVNEILKMLPGEIQSTLHEFMITLWNTGLTPTKWKESETALLYKKDDAMDILNYRPIGLANTLYKLWTRLVTVTIYKYAEAHNVLSQAQAGFRQKRKTADQLELLTMLLEDAKHTAQDVFLMQIDFSAAFNTINHDKLLCIMYDLGIPTDAIDVVKGIYTDSYTRYKTPYGSTDPIKVDRGTLQGDTLSPLLFILYLEPLLRWLHVGGRGYQFGCAPDTEKLELMCSNLTYADDLNVPVTTREDLKVQAYKIDKYSTWADLKINLKKSAVTGILHSATLQKQHGTSNPTDNKTLKAMLQDTVKIQGGTLKFQPPRQAFTFLGLEYTMTLNWQTHYNKVIVNLANTLQKLTRSWASTRQKENILHTCVKKAVEYGMSTVAYTATQIKKMDSLITAAAKRIYGLSRSVSTAMIHEDKEAGGLGCPSMEREYLRANVKSLVEALNNTGPVGKLTRHLLKTQLENLNILDTLDARNGLLHCIRLRQLALMNNCKLELTDYTTPDALNNTAHTLQQQFLKLQSKLGTNKPNIKTVAQLANNLNKLGLNSLQDIIDSEKMTMYTPQDIQRKYGLKLNQHQSTVLHKLTAVLNGRTATNWKQHGTKGTDALPIHLRTVHDSMYTEVARLELNITAVTQRTPMRIIPMPVLLEKMRLLHKAEKRPLTKAPKQTKQKGTRTALGDPSYRPQGYKRQMQDEREQGWQPYRTRTRTKLAEAQHATATQMPDIDVPEHSTTIANKAMKELRDNGVHAALQYVPTAKINKIDGWRKVKTTQTADNPFGTLREETHEDQFLVHWAPQVLEEWAIQITQAAGFTLIDKTEHTQEDWAQHEHDCSICGKEICDEPAICDKCHRQFHEKHLGPEPRDEDWTCMECSHYLQINPRTDITNTAHYKLSEKYWTTWAPTWHTEDYLIQQGYAEETSAYVQVRDAEPDRTAIPADAHLTNMQRQGIHNLKPVHEYITDNNLKNKVTIETRPVNPQLDIEPTGAYELTTRTVPVCQMTKQGVILGVRKVGAVCAYDPDGKFVGAVPEARLHDLYSRFVHTATYKPDIFKKFDVVSFEMEIALMLQRYKNGTANLEAATNEVKTENHWATPNPLQEIFMEFFTISEEVYSGPHNYNLKMLDYRTAHERDQVFGATHDAYSKPLSGSSAANPEYEHDEMHKAMKWAVYSALRSKQPTLTLLLLPDWSETSNTAYNKWYKMQPNIVRTVATIPRKLFKFSKPMFLSPEDEFAGNPRWDVKVMIVANVAGYDKYCKIKDDATYKKFLARVATVLSQINEKCITSQQLAKHCKHFPAITDDTENEHLGQFDPTMNPGKTFKRAMEKELVATDEPPMLQQQYPLVPNNTKTRMDWTQVLYTDGSKMDKTNEQGNDITRVGAAVYKPDSVTGLQGTYVRINPGGRGATKTINRSELIALKHALQMDDGRQIATDSLVSLSNINRALADHHNLEFSKHYDLLKAIRTIIQNRQHPVHLIKVKSHAGIIGNEMADKYAKQATEQYDETDNTGENAFEHLTWLQTKDTPSRHIGDLTGDLLKHCHALHKYGHSNQDSVYFQAWKNIQSKIDQKASTKFMTDDKVTRSERTNALKYKTGDIYTRKKAAQFKLVPDSNCILCGQPDGGHHSVSGCPAIGPAVNNRHNDAGQILLKYTLQGQYGGNVLCADVGSRTKLHERLNAILPRKIPSNTEYWQDLATNSIPDIVLVNKKKHRKTGKRMKTEIHLVEIKYCQDTRPEHQQEKAQSQHEALVKTLEKHKQYKVKLHTILLGVAGTIYKDMNKTLKQLGLSATQTTKCVNELHIHGIQSLTKCLNYKRTLEREQNADYMQRPSKRKQSTTASTGNKRRRKPSAVT